MPEGVDGKAVAGRLLHEHGIEIGGGLGRRAPDVAHRADGRQRDRGRLAERVLDALDAVLADEPAFAASA